MQNVDSGIHNQTAQHDEGGIAALVKALVGEAEHQEHPNKGDRDEPYDYKRHEKRFKEDRTHETDYGYYQQKHPDVLGVIHCTV